MRSILRELLETLLLTVLIFLLVRTVVQNFKVDGQSMEPTLYGGQYLLINKAVYWRVDGDLLAQVLSDRPRATDGGIYVFQAPSRGDVVVFRFPRDESRDFIKRVIGLPGETVEARGGTIYVNGAPLREPYVKEPPAYPLPPTRVPPGHYFVLGDNRNNSSDSHSWGVVPEDNIVGRAWMRYWPLAEWGFISSVPLNGVAAVPPLLERHVLLERHILGRFGVVEQVGLLLAG
ncbi:MAG: signal peptidase I [Chloroflexi bacterium]|nr:signal peptidase I [Chloroflexota bacterium]